MADRHTLAYPTNWPEGWPRTPAERRTASRFHNNGRSLSLPAARDRLNDQLRMLGIHEAILSTDLPLRLDGGIRRDVRPSNVDGAVALHFARGNGQRIALAADRFETPAENVAALAAYLEALRATERHGVGNLDRVFTGYLALAAPASWQDVLEQPATLAEAEATYRRLAKAAHQDGAGEDRIKQLNVARDQAREALK